MAKRVKIGAAPRPLEKHIQAKVVAYARTKHGCLVRKMNGLGYRSWPDDMFITLSGRVFFLEAKRQGEKPTEQQMQMINELVRRDVLAGWYNSVEAGKYLVDSMVGEL